MAGTSAAKTRGGKLNQGHPRNLLIPIPVLHVGGTEAQTLLLVRALRRAAYAVEVCCYFEASRPVVEAFEREGARVTLLGLGSSDHANTFWELLRVGRSLFRFIRLRRPDVVHVQYIAPGLVPLIAAFAAGTPRIFATVHQPGYPYGLRAKVLIHLASCLTSGFFCVSRAVEESWFGDSALFDANALANRRHFTLYDCVDLAPFTAVTPAEADVMRRELGLTGRRVVGVVGRLTREKGHAVLLAALPEVVQVVPSVTLMVVGSGQDRANLEAQAREVGVTDHVIWLGQRAWDELPKLYAAMDVVAVPSLFEGFGLVAAEAMAASRPVVASAVGGVVEVVEHDVTGYLVATRNPHALAAALVDLLSHPEVARDMGSAGCRRVREKFSFERYSQRMAAAYSLLGAGRR